MGVKIDDGCYAIRLRCNEDPPTLRAHRGTQTAPTLVTVLVISGGQSLLFESQMRTRVLPVVLSGTLTARVQLYCPVAMATRQAKSIAVIRGTGSPPVFT
jgi:hypothetical protein